MMFKPAAANYPRRRGNFSDRLIFLVLGASIALNVYFLFFEDKGEGGGETEGVEVSAIPSHSSPYPAPKSPPPPEAPIQGEGERPIQLKLKVKDNLYRTFVNALGKEEGKVLEAFFSRIFMWVLDLRKDVRNGDEIELNFIWKEGGDDPDSTLPVYPEISFSTYHSRKHNTLYRAYRYKPASLPFPRYFNEEGVEYALSLINSPIEGYEEITSLVFDRRKHKGIDFKTPVGTKIRTPFRAKVIRKNWNWKYNGNCVEIEYLEKGVSAIFLHLNKIYENVRAGKILEAGEYFAESGNTGRTTAPHLHYQLESLTTDKVIDPLKYHETYRIRMEGDDMIAFKKYIALKGDI